MGNHLGEPYWAFCTRNGMLYLDGHPIATGYSGHGVGRNNPALEASHGVGPIPSGLWFIKGPPEDTMEHGPFVLRLQPAPGTLTFGRSGFLIHGDSKHEPGTASLGCIILDRQTREHVWASGIRELLVLLVPVVPALRSS